MQTLVLIYLSFPFAFLSLSLLFFLCLTATRLSMKGEENGTWCVCVRGDGWELGSGECS